MRTLAEIVPLRTPACRDAVDAVAMIAAGEDGVDRRAADHVATCLRCQAEVVAYRRVLVMMRSMRHDRLALPVGGLDGTLHAVRSDGPAGGEGAAAWALRAAYVGGITAASAAGVLVWISRRRPGLPNAS